jgi:hypothetical protein
MSVPDNELPGEVSRPVDSHRSAPDEELIPGRRDARLYRVTAYSHQALAAVLHVRYNRFPSAFLQAA